MGASTQNGSSALDHSEIGNDGFTHMSTMRSLPFTLLRTRVAVMANFSAFLADRGKTEQQWRVLRLLGTEKAMDATRLAKRACIMAPSLTRILKALTIEGLIASKRDPQDGRRIKISLTKAGTQLLQQSMPKSLEIYDQIIETFGREKTDKLLDLLVELESALTEPPQE